LKLIRWQTGRRAHKIDIALEIDRLPSAGARPHTLALAWLVSKRTGRATLSGPPAGVGGKESLFDLFQAFFQRELFAQLDQSNSLRVCMPEIVSGSSWPPNGPTMSEQTNDHH